MILALSRFKVANNMQEDVRAAFAQRPRLVDRVPGFLGLETFVDHADETMFYLETRWNDAETFHAWHHSPAHHASHKHMPRGLKLDPKATRLIELERFSGPCENLSSEQHAMDHAFLMSTFVQASRSIVMLALDGDGTVRQCAGGVEQTLGRTAPSLVGKTVEELVVAKDAGALRARMAAGQRTPDARFLLNFLDEADMACSVECQLDTSENGFILIGEPPRREDHSLHLHMMDLNHQMSLLMRENAQKTRALEIAMRDLKDAQSMLVQQEKMASLGRVTAGVAHEINNPLSFVLSNQTTLLRDFQDAMTILNLVGDHMGELEAACPSLAKLVLDASENMDLPGLCEGFHRKIEHNLEGLERIKDIVLDLRRFSRLDEGERKTCRISEGLTATARFLQPLLKEAGVDLRTDLADLPPVSCNPGHVNQAVDSILTNAIQASRPGQTVWLKTALRGADQLIQVRDEGEGIAPDVLPHVYDPFFTTRPVGSGTGLGLSIARQLVVSQGGEISIESEVGRGTTVSIVLKASEDGVP